MFMEAVANRTRQHTHWGKARENKVAHGTAPRPTRKESESVLNREGQWQTELDNTHTGGKQGKTRWHMGLPHG